MSHTHATHTARPLAVPRGLSQETEAPYLGAPSLGEVAGNAGRPKLGHGEVIKQKASGL